MNDCLDWWDAMPKEDSWIEAQDMLEEMRKSSDEAEVEDNYYASMSPDGETYNEFLDTL